MITELKITKGDEAATATVEVSDSFSLTEVLDTVLDAVYPLTVAASLASPAEPLSGDVELASDQYPLVKTGIINFLPQALEQEPVAEPVIDWATAPEGATHRNGPYGLWYKFDFEANTASFCTDFSRSWSDGDKASVYVADGSLADMIARPTSPIEKWSLNGKNGSWDYDTLAELLKDHSPDHVDAGPHGSYNSEAVYEGSVVYRAIECKDDPAGFLPDADQITEIMCDNAMSSDAGEWVDEYPSLDKQALVDLDKALEPLKAWARKHCQPKFFTVKDVTPYTVTAEDVEAAQ